jgi:large subunit ribosomal protein L10
MSEKIIAEKRKSVDGLKQKIAKANLVLISEYLKFTVKEFTDLRRKLRAEESEIKVMKNTLIRKAVVESGFPQVAEHITGSTAIILGYKDAVSPLKILVKFIKENEKGAVRVGVVEKNVYVEKELNELAKLPAKEVLIARVVGGFQAPLYGLVNVLQGPIRKLVYVLDAIKTKKGGE